VTQCDLYRKSLDQKFAEYHAENPQVFAKFVSLAEQAKQRGRPRIGAKFLLELVRWNTPVSAAGDDFKINNSYVSRYVRLLASSRPDLGALFATRKLKSQFRAQDDRPVEA
jgi:hypothetical protein